MLVWLLVEIITETYAVVLQAIQDLLIMDVKREYALKCIIHALMKICQ